MLIDITGTIEIEDTKVTFCNIENLSETIAGDKYLMLSPEERGNYIIKSHLDIFHNCTEVDVLTSDVFIDTEHDE